MYVSAGINASGELLSSWTFGFALNSETKTSHITEVHVLILVRFDATASYTYFFSIVADGFTDIQGWTYQCVHFILRWVERGLPLYFLTLTLAFFPSWYK